MVHPLHGKDLTATVANVADLNDRVRRRLRDEMTDRNLSQQDVADLLKWTQSRVAQKLTGRTPITLDELEALAFAVGLSLPELVRDHGLEFCAEMTPTELRMFQLLRKLPINVRDSVFTLLRVPSSSKPDRHAKPLKRAIGKGRG